MSSAAPAEQSSSSNTPPAEDEELEVSVSGTERIGEIGFSEIQQEEIIVESEIVEVGLTRVEEVEQMTPKGEEYRIPVSEDCPPAPKKQARMFPGSSSRKRSAESAFYVPPDSEVFSSHSRSQHHQQHQRLRLEIQEQHNELQQVEEEKTGEEEEENQQVEQQEIQERVDEQEIQGKQKIPEN